MTAEMSKRDLYLLYGDGRGGYQVPGSEGSTLEIERQPFTGACEGVGGGPAMILVEVPDDGAFPIPWAHGYRQAALMQYAARLFPIGQPTEPPKKPSPKPSVAPASTPLRDRKAELRRLKADKARAARLVKRLKSRKPQVFTFKGGKGTMELNGQSFPIRDVKFEWAAHFYQRSRELLGGK